MLVKWKWIPTKGYGRTSSGETWGAPAAGGWPDLSLPKGNHPRWGSSVRWTGETAWLWTW